MFSNGELKFGEEMYFAIFALRGDIDIKKCEVITNDIIDICGMRTGCLEAACWKIPPLGEEKIGDSFTYVQPILTSLIACDQWVELQGAWLIIVSCSPFDYEKLEEYMDFYFPVNVGTHFNMRMPKFTDHHRLHWG